MSFNDSFAGYLLFEIMMRVLNNKNRKNEKSVAKNRNLGKRRANTLF